MGVKIIIMTFAVLALASSPGYADNFAVISDRQMAGLPDHSLNMGDIVFIQIESLPFKRIAQDTGSWTNHVGVVVDVAGKEPLVAESTFPYSKITRFSAFIKRSGDKRYEVKRFRNLLTAEEQKNILPAARKRLGIFYDTGFNLHSKKQFCSRFVAEVLAEATGEQIGKTETLANLFADNSNAHLGFWRLWYFGNIPWERKTITPAGMLNDDRLFTVVSGERGKYSVHLP